MAKKKGKFGRSNNLTNPVIGYKVQNMRKIVQDRMKEIPMTAYAVAKATGVKAQTMSDFLRGAAMRSDKLEKVFAVLGLEVRRK